jgi:DNA modification methylase
MNKIEFGDNREIMKRWIAEGIKVQTCVTSPPYFGLRDYSTAKWVGGDESCDHVERHSVHGGERADRDQTSQIFQYKEVCGKCGAIREDKQIGLEETPEEFINNLVDVFRHVRDILADDGTIWVNIGDSYNSFGGNHSGRSDNQVGVGAGQRQWREGSARADGEIRSDGLSRRNRNGVSAPDLKPKDLIGIPWMLAFALRADGWYLRQDIIWHKPNPMPESVTDRCTKAHEYIFLLSKSQKYFFDHEAIKEEAIGGTPGNTTHKGKTAYESGDEKMRTKMGLTEIGAVEKRNKRSVWSVNTKPYKGAHFAVYPEKLITPCILAGSKFGDVVFDPFMGSGTTAAVAIKNGRQYMGCELNPNYGPLQQQRIDEAVKTKPPIIDGDPDSLFTFGNP